MQQQSKKLTTKVKKWDFEMKLLTKAILKAFEKQGDTSEKEPKDIKIICKFFNPAGAGMWYMYEYNPEDKIFWGFANLGWPEMAECGTIALQELEEIRLPFGLKIERDLHYGDHTLQEVIDENEKMIR